MTPAQANALKSALRKTFPGRVEAERLNGRGRYRFAIVSTQFAKMSHLRRQDVIWKVVDSILPRQATVDISLILAFAPHELQAKQKN